MSNSQCNRDGRPATFRRSCSHASHGLLRDARRLAPCRQDARGPRGRPSRPGSCRVGDWRATTATETTRRAAFGAARAAARRADRFPEAVRATIVRAADTHAGVMKRTSRRRRRGRRASWSSCAATCRARRTAAICVRDGARSLGGPGRRRTDDRSRGRGVGAHFSPATRPVGPEARCATCLPTFASGGSTQIWRDSRQGRHSGDGSCNRGGFCRGRSCRGRGGTRPISPSSSFPNPTERGLASVALRGGPLVCPSCPSDHTTPVTPPPFTQASQTVPRHSSRHTLRAPSPRPPRPPPQPSAAAATRP